MEPVKPKKTRAVIDIPMDEPPAFEKEEPVSEPKKKKFFNRESRVPAPDQLLTGAMAAPAAQPEPEPAPNPEPVSMPVIPPEPFPDLESEPESEMPAAAAAAPVQPKVKPEEAAQAAAEVTAEIEESMSQPVIAYQYPPVSLLVEGDGSIGADALGELKNNQTRLADTIHSFGIEVKSHRSISRGSSSQIQYQMLIGCLLSGGRRYGILQNLGPLPGCPFSGWPGPPEPPCRHSEGAFRNRG